MILLSVALWSAFGGTGESLAKDKDASAFSSKVKANTMVSIAAGNQAKAITRLGSIDLKSGKPRHFDIKIGYLMQQNVGDHALSCIQGPNDETHCR